MMQSFLRKGLCCIVVIFYLTATLASAQRQMEKLGRGVVALHSATSQAYIGWRLLATDSTDVGFNIYRITNGVLAGKLNSVVLTNTTDFLDTTANFTYSNAWYVVPVIAGVEQTPSAAYGLVANPPVRQYIPIPLQPVIGGASPPYDVKFCWVGDFDGDGEYDFLVDRLSTTTATNQYLQAYKRDGTFLWQMDMGYNSTNQYNIEPGSSAISVGHGDNVTVYDLDGDGKAEVIVRTAKGVVFGDGAVAIGPDDTTQYLSIIDGLTGHEITRATITNLWPADGPMSGHFGIMYCDGVHPSVLVHCENRNSSQAFQRETMTYDYRDGQLTRRWFHTPAVGANESWGHQIRIMDVNHDGIDDLINVGSALNGVNGQPLFDTELQHGDRFHIADIDPDRPGLEMFAIQQNNPTLLATAFIDMGNGSLIKKWYSSGVVDVGRGTTLDLDASHRGYEMYSTQPGIFDCKGNQIYANSIWPPEAIWWDADLSRELEDGAGSGALSPVINKFDPAFGTAGRVYSIYSEGVHQAYGGRAAFWGDILGDWREELVLVANDYSEIRIYTTKIAATNRLYCLMQNPAYRDQTTCKGYYQASYVDYYLGNDMPPPPPAPVSDAKLVWRGDGTNVWDAASTANWRTNWFYVGNANTNSAPFNPGDTVLFDLTGSNNTAIAITGSLTPGEVRIHSPRNYTFDGPGELTGAMKLTKAGAGKLTLNGTNTYTGKTLIGEGQFIVNGSLPNSPLTVRGGVWLDGRLGGNGVVGSPVVIYEGAGVSPGAGTNSPGTLTIVSNLTLAGRTLNDFDLSDNPTGTTNDLLVVTGNLTLQGTNTIIIRKLNPTLPPGTIYPLINYSGTLSGGLSNFVISGLPGIPVVLTNAPGQIALVVKSFRAPATISWTGGTGGNTWDLLVSSNWLNGVAKDQFAPNDNVRFDSTGATNPTVNLSGDLNAASLVVDTTSNYTFTGSGSIIGACNLAKSNSGTLTISALNNSYTGKTTIAGGTVIVSELDAIGFPSPLGNPPGGSTNLVLSGNSTLRITGESYTDRGMTLNAGTNTIEVFNGSDQVTVANQIIGSGALLKAGAGNLALTVANSYSGGTFIYGGVISLGSTAGNSSGLGSGLVTISNATLSMIDIQASETAAWNLNVLTNSTGRLDCDGRCTLSGSLIGGGTFTVMTPYVRTDFSGNWSAFTGQLNVIADADGGDFRCNNSAGYPNAKVNLANLTSLQNRVGGTPTISIGELSGVQGCSASAGGGNSGLAVNWSVGGLNTSATFAGSTYNGIGFIKVGTGTWTWTGTNIAHTGQTTVNGGTLLINGNAAPASGAVTVGTSGTLGGIGTIGGATTVNGQLAPGSASIGTLTFNGNLTLASTSASLIEINKTAGTKDLASVVGTLTYGGTLQVTNLAGTLANSNSFKIFNAGTYAGSFSAYNLPVLTAGLAWDTTALNTSGTLSVISTNALPPPPAAPGGLSATAVSFSQINLAWTDNSTNEDNFLLERSPNNTNFTQIASLGAGVTNRSDTGLSANTLYYYRVRASNTGGNSAFSNTNSATTLVAPTGLIWRGDGSANLWDIATTSNWLNGGALAQFANGAGVTFDDTGSNNVAVALSGSPQPASITVNATKNYTFGSSGLIAGSGSLIKSGSGSLTLTNLGNNTFSGGVLISNGIVELGLDSGAASNENQFGLGTGPVTINTNGQLRFGGRAGNNTQAYFITNAVTLNGGTIFAVDSDQHLSNSVVDVQAGGGTLLARWSGKDLFIESKLTGSGPLMFGFGGPATTPGAVLYLANPFNTYSGTLSILTNTVVLTTPYALSNAVLNVQGTGTSANLTWSGITSIVLGGLSGAGNISLGANQLTVGFNDSSTEYSGALSGAGSLTKNGAGTFTLSGANTYSGLTTNNSGTLQIGNNGTTGTLGTSSVVNNATLAFNRSDNISDHGSISGTGNLAQIGDGTLTLSNAHTYTGATTIESGTLALISNGSIASSPSINISLDALLDVSGHTGGGMILASGQTLSGNGAVKGNLTLASGAKLKPGNSIGTLTFSNSLALSAGSSTTMEISKAPIANDVLNVLGTLTYGGALVVTNISGLSLTAGDSFPLFNEASHASSFSSLTLPPLGTNLAWDTNSFIVSGTLSVINTAPPAISSIAARGDGNFRLTFSGPTGWDYELRASTNIMLTPVTLWDLLDSGTFGNGPVIFDDLSATNYPQRYYLLLLP